MGCIIIRDNKENQRYYTDGQSEDHWTRRKLSIFTIKRIMTKRPISIDKNELAAKH